MKPVAWALTTIAALAGIIVHGALPGAGAAAASRLTVAAAASLSLALDEIAASYEEETGVKVVVSYGSTGMLARQIIHGAPFDVFFAAHESYIEDLKEKGLVMEGTETTYAEGRLAMAVNRSAGAAVSTLADLASARVRRIALANPSHAPYGRAARQALESAGVWETVREKVVYGENVRQVLRFVRTGDVPVGIVALSVARAEGVDTYPVDPSLHEPVRQAAAVLRRAADGAEAGRFLRYAAGPAGRAVFTRYGLAAPAGAR